MSMNKISVVIPALNEEANIRETLNSLFANTKLPYEVIVVDGGSADRTREIVKKAFPEAVLLYNQRRTAATGRNLGIQKARGDIVAFTDGDCYVDKHWIESIDRFFETYEIDGMRGRVCNASPRNNIDRYWGELAWERLMAFGDEIIDIRARDIRTALVTANCAYSRELLGRLNGFDEWFGNNAEDIDLCWRAIDAGARLKYNPEARIYSHNVTTLKGVMKKSFRNGVSSSKLQKVYGSRINFDPSIYRMLGRTFGDLLTRKQDAFLNLVELFSHLNGKYYGSVKYGVINF